MNWNLSIIRDVIQASLLFNQIEPRTSIENATISKHLSYWQALQTNFVQTKVLPLLRSLTASHTIVEELDFGADLLQQVVLHLLGDGIRHYLTSHEAFLYQPELMYPPYITDRQREAAIDKMSKMVSV